MDKLMDSPWFLRFTALFLAIVLFFSVRVEEEKSAGKTVGDSLDSIRDVQVEVYYDNENLVVTGVPETVNVTIEGPANIVQTTKLLKDFTLKVDLRSLPMGRHTVEIQHENLSDKLQVRLDPSIITVVIEEKITQTFRVDPELNERLLAEDFSVVRMDAVPSTIEVTGAKSVIEAISFVKASATGNQGIDKSFEHQARVRVLDRDLNKLNLTIVPEQVTVRVEVSEFSKEVPIVLKRWGTPPAGVDIESIEADKKFITLSGSRRILDQIKEFNIEVDVSEVKGKGTMEIDLKKPTGVSGMSFDKVKVNIDAKATSTDSEQDEASTEIPATTEDTIATREFDTIPISIRGLDEKFKGSIKKPAEVSVRITVTAEQAVVDTLKKSDFTVYVDASGAMSEGERNLPVVVEGPANVRYKLSEEEVTMHIELA